MAADTPRRQRGHPASLDDGPLSWQAMSCAIGLLTRLELCREVPRSAVLDGQEPGEVLAAMELVAGALLEILYPGEQAAAALRALGHLAAERAAQETAGGQK